MQAVDSASRSLCIGCSHPFEFAQPTLPVLMEDQSAPAALYSAQISRFDFCVNFSPPKTSFLGQIVDAGS